MSGIGDAVKSLTNTALATTLPADTPFMRNARPFGIYASVTGLVVLGGMALWLKDAIVPNAVVLALGTIAREFARFRSLDRQADISAANIVPAAPSAP